MQTRNVDNDNNSIYLATQKRKKEKMCEIRELLYIRIFDLSFMFDILLFAGALFVFPHPNWFVWENSRKPEISVHQSCWLFIKITIGNADLSVGGTAIGTQIECQFDHWRLCSNSPKSSP